LTDLASWTDGPTKSAIVDFVGRVTTEGGPDYVEQQERVAVFDNDGTLWCEKPMPVELGFILERLAASAEADAALRDRRGRIAGRGGHQPRASSSATRRFGATMR